MKTIIISNRLPFSVSRNEQGLNLVPSVGGLATSLGSVFPPASTNDLWIGWPGIDSLSPIEETSLKEDLLKHQHVPVFLTKREVQMYYDGFCNRTIWPIFHQLSHTTSIDEWWESYVEVNRKFCDVIVSNADENTKIWINDYHLMLLPKFLKEKKVAAKVAFFLHTPFPPRAAFHKMAKKKELLEGLLEADSIGFYLQDYRSNFYEAIEKYVPKLTKNSLKSRNVGVYPISIDYRKYRKLAISPEVKKNARKLRESLDSDVVFLSIDRLDHSKGIPEKIMAFERLLHAQKENKKRCCLFLVVVPSRENIPSNIHLRKEIEKMVNRINRTYGNKSWRAIVYHYDSFDIQSISSFYSMSDVMVITSKMDGMNLVSKEFVASRVDADGVLILSKNAGAARELSEASIVDPHDIDDIYIALRDASDSNGKVNARKMKNMQRLIRNNDVKKWALEFMSSI